MYKNQLQELAQRSCFNLPSYTCIREGPDHAPRFKAIVNFNGENFESPAFCTTLRQAEHAAAEVALSALSKHGPSRSLAARVLDETGVYKNLLQETAHRAGLNLPVYTTVRSGPGHTPVFTCTVELAGLSFMGDPSKTKKQAQKNAALAAWSALKQLPHLDSSSQPVGSESNEQQEQVIVARALTKLHSLDGSKQSSRNDRSRSRRRSVTIQDGINSGGGGPLYSAPVPYQRWVHSNFFPEVAIYQLWHQEHSPRKQSNLLTLPLLAPTSDSRSVPYMQPIIKSAQNQCFPITEQDQLDSFSCFSESSGSSLFFPGYASLVPSCGSSHMSIHGMHEERSSMRKESRPGAGISNIDRDVIGQQVNLQQNSMMSPSPSEVSNHALSVDRASKLKYENLRGDKQGCSWSSITDMPSKEKDNISNSGLLPTTTDSLPLVIHDSGAVKNIQEVQQREGIREKYEWMHTGTSRSMPSSPSNLSFMLKNIGVFDSTQSAHNPSNLSTAACSLGLSRGSQSPQVAARGTTRSTLHIHQAIPRIDASRIKDSFMASPVKIRTAIPVCSARPGNLSSHGFAANTMAPAVNVRSVVPVCAAPPVRVSSSIQMTQEPGGPEDISVATSRFSKLHI